MEFMLCKCILGHEKNVLYTVGSGYLVRLSPLRKIRIRSTMENLLIYMLENGIGKLVTDTEIMEMVWDNNSLRSSSQRLWKVMNNLKAVLFILGVEDVILRVSGKGYVISPCMVQSLYCEKGTSSFSELPVHADIYK